MEDVKVQLFDIINHVANSLRIARVKMVLQYGKNVKEIKYTVNDKVWLQKKTFKSDENKKMSPRKSGPWTIIKVYPDNVNFKIVDHSGQTQVVHHNRLSPVKTKNTDDEPCYVMSDNESSCRSNDENESVRSSDEENEGDRRYPLRTRRRQRDIPGDIP